MASDRPLIDEMMAAGGNASFSDLAASDRDQPSVPQPRRRRRCGDRRRHEPTAGVTDVSSKQTHEHRRRRSLTSRRHFLRGVGVALALPWMESLPLFGAERAGSGQGEHAAAAAGHRLLLERRRADSLVGEGQRRDHGARAGGAADDAAPRGHGLHPGALQPDGARLDQPAPRPHERAVGRAGQPRSRTRSASARRWIRSSPSQIGGRTADPEPRARHRAERAAARRRPVDDLRLEPVVGLADQAGDQGDLSVARVRSPGRRRHGPHARSQHPRRGAAGLAEPAAEDQPRRQRQADRVPSNPSATSRSGSSGRRRKSASKAGGRRWPSPTCRGRRTSCRRTCPIT